MKRMIVASLALALTALSGVIARANDEQIAQQIVERLQQQRQSAKLKDFNIGVQVEKGTVTMMGSVANPNHALLALDIARRIQGVKLVVNDLYVQAQPGAPTAQAGIPQAPQVVAIQAPLAINPPVPQGMAPQAVVSAPSGLTTAAVAPTPTANVSVTPVVQPTQAVFAAAPVTPAPAPAPVSAAQTRIATQPAPRIAQAPFTMPATIPVPPRPQQFNRETIQQQAIGSGIRQQATARSQTPLAFARVGTVRQASHVSPEYAQSQPAQYSYSSGQGPSPVPMTSAGGSGIARASYDNPQMPAHAWPSYAAYPNYAAVSYPQQYSATAWPYIGPFYPYPQVPLGWRKVMLEWDDGWWFLDFKSK